MGLRLHTPLDLWLLGVVAGVGGHLCRRGSECTRPTCAASTPPAAKPNSGLIPFSESFSNQDRVHPSHMNARLTPAVGETDLFINSRLHTSALKLGKATYFFDYLKVWTPHFSYSLFLALPSLLNTEWRRWLYYKFFSSIWATREISVSLRLLIE